MWAELILLAPYGFDHNYIIHDYMTC